MVLSRQNTSNVSLTHTHAPILAYTHNIYFFSYNIAMNWKNKC